DGYAGLVLDRAGLFPPVRRPSAADEVAEAPPDPNGPGRTGAGLPPALPPGAAPDPGTLVRQRLTRFLERQTGRRHGDDLRAWRRWLWSRPYEPHPAYLFFKAMTYHQLD